MTHCEGQFLGADNLELYYQSWYPETKARACIVIVHGLGAHSGWFKNIVKSLIPKHYAIYSLDLRGHGRSPGPRGHINAWSELREDLRCFLQLVQAKQPECPCFLLGHSFGAAIVLDYVLRCPTESAGLQGVIALSPALKQVGVSPFKLFLGHTLSRLFPQFTLSTGLDLDAGSRDPAVVAAIGQDPLRHDRASARLATEFFITVEWIQAHAVEWRLPLLILQGGADRVTLPEGGQLFCQQVGCADKEYREYPGGYHEPHNDLDYPKVIADLENWLERHLPVPKSKENEV